MRTKILSFILLAGTVVGCATTPPPPPPMVEAPPPPPPAPVMGIYPGMYKGMADASTDMPKGCAKMTRPASVVVRPNGTFVLGGIRGMIAADGTISSKARGMSLTGMSSPTGLDVTEMKGKCTYHYMLAKS